MKLSNLLDEKLILPSVAENTPAGVLRAVAARIAEAHGLDEARVFKTLVDREKLGSTGIEEGLAVPHGKYPGLNDMIACLARSPEGVDFAARDNRPTHLFVVLLAPENDAGKHLKALARVSRLFKQEHVRRRLRQAESATQMLDIISEEDARL